ncbi:MAG: hypothetical protein K0Q43_3962 [Ramlibacter sp.]|nr:hypothetical protein [Ramlibacter sp.]
MTSRVGEGATAPWAGSRRIRRAISGDSSSASSWPLSTSSGCLPVPSRWMCSVSPGSRVLRRSSSEGGGTAPGALLSNSGLVLPGASICMWTRMLSRSSGGHTGRMPENSASRNASTGRRIEKKARRAQSGGVAAASMQRPLCHSQPRKSRSGRAPLANVGSPVSSKPVRRPRTSAASGSDNASKGAIHLSVSPRMVRLTPARCTASRSSSPRSRGTSCPTAKRPTR